MVVRQEKEQAVMPVYTGYQWPSPNLTWSFVPDGTMLFGSPSVLFSLYDARFPRDKWQGEFVRAIQEWTKYSLLTLTQIVGVNVTGLENIKFGASLGVTGLGHAMLPTGGLVGLNGHGALNIGSNPDMFSVVLHELGGALGLGEGSPNPSVMNGPGPYYGGLFPDDVEGIQHLYGVNPNAPSIPTIPPTAPQGFVGPLAAELAWQAVPGALGYQLQKSSDGVHFAHYADPMDPEFTDSFHRGPFVWYRVRAVNAVGTGPWSATLKV